MPESSSRRSASGCEAPTKCRPSSSREPCPYLRFPGLDGVVRPRRQQGSASTYPKENSAVNIRERGYTRSSIETGWLAPGPFELFAGTIAFRAWPVDGQHGFSVGRSMAHCAHGNAPAGVET